MGSPGPSSTEVAKLRGTRGFHVPPCRKHPKCGEFGVSMSRRDGNRPRCSKLGVHRACNLTSRKRLGWSRE
jgi:hypothetical protein